MAKRHRVYDRRILKGTLTAAFLTSVLVGGALYAPDTTGWLGFLGAPVFAVGVMFNLARDGGMSSATGGYFARRVYFALLALCCVGWGAIVYFVLTRS